MKKLILLGLIIIYQINLLYSQIEIECDEFSQVIDSNHILVKKGNNYGIIDINGKLLIDYTIKDPIISENILLTIKSNASGLSELIDLSTLKPIWSGNVTQYHPFTNGYAHIYDFRDSDMSTSSFFIDKQGRKIFDLPKNTNNIKYGETFSFSNEVVRIPINNSKTNEEYFIYLDNSGNKIMEKSFSIAKDFYYDLAKTCVKKYDNFHWGFIDKKGNVIIDYLYTKEPTSFSDSIARVENTNGLFGFINLKGNIVLEPQYVFATGFYKGFALVKKDYTGEFLLINKKGEIIKTYNSFKHFNRSDRTEQSILFIKELVDNGILNTGTSYAKFIDYDGKVLFNEKGLTVDEFKNGLAKFSRFNLKTGKTVYGILNKKGETILIKKDNQF